MLPNKQYEKKQNIYISIMSTFFVLHFQFRTIILEYMRNKSINTKLIILAKSVSKRKFVYA